MKNYSCKFCGKHFKRYPSTVRNPDRVFCSRTCLGKHQKKELKGINNPNFKNGKYTDPTCDCGNPKDPRALKCSKCSHKSFPVGNPEICSKEEIKKAISNSTSIVEASKNLKVSRSYLKKQINIFSIKIDHFIKCGKRPSTQKDLKRNSRLLHPSVKRIVLEENLLEYRCYECGQGMRWQGKELTLQLHHLNGDKYDNRIKNLTILCPNCHSQTHNWKGKNHVKKRK